jgi:hypothetical protein
MPRLLATFACVTAFAGSAAAEPLVIPIVNLVVKDDPTPPIVPKKRSFKLRSGTRQEPVVHIVPPAIGSPGDPTIGGGVLTVLNTGGAPQVQSHPLPAARWTVIGSAENFKGWKFHDDTPADGPVMRVFVKPDKLYVSGGKTNWTYLLGATRQGSVSVRLALGTDDGWCMEAPAKAPVTIFDTPAKFVGLKGAIPASCPPLP